MINITSWENGDGTIGCNIYINGQYLEGYYSLSASSYNAIFEKYYNRGFMIKEGVMRD